MLRQTRLFLLLIIVVVGLLPGYRAFSSSDTAWALSQSPAPQQRSNVQPGAHGGASALDEDAPYVAGRLLVQFAPGTPDEEKAAVHERLGAQVIDEIPALGIQILQVPEEATSMVFAYQAEPSVNFAEPDYIARIAGWPDGPILSSNDLEAIGEGVTRYPNDPRFPDMWNLAKIRAEAGWDITTGSSSVIIAVIDTGADAHHPDLDGKLLPAYDFVNNDSDPADDQGHGTHVSGTAAAMTNNGIGIAGVSWGAKVMPIKALSASGSGAHSWIANGIVWATDHGADVINMSLGGPYTSATMSRAVDYAWSHGVVIVAAAGNGNTSNPSYPAAYDKVIGVAATTQNDERARFSNYGSYISVASPGVSILSSTRGGGYQAWSGTSMASPHVAGLAALIKSIHPDWSNVQIRDAIESSSVDFGTPGWDAIYGWGRIDIYNAVSSDAPPPTDTPTPTPTPTSTPERESTPLPDLEQQLIDAINQWRATQGLPPFHRDERLMQAARRHSLDMGDNELCSHTGSDGSDPFDRIRDSGYPMASGSEVIACGYQTPDDVVQGWANSPPHRTILTSESYVDIGCGVVQAPSRTRYWTCNPARPNDLADPSPTTVTPSVTPVPVTDTPTPSPTPTRTPSPEPIDPVNPSTVYITPEPLDVGWVASNEAANNHFSDDDIYAGIHGGQIYIGAVQFDLSQIPPGSKINWARLTLTGQTRDYVGDSGSWSVSLLSPDIDANWRSHDYLHIRDATSEHLILPIMANSDLQREKENTFNLDATIMRALERRLTDTQRVSLRIDGPTAGPNNLFSWDSGYGVGGILKAPVLTINYTPGGGGDITPTPTPTQTTSPTPPSGGGEAHVLDLKPAEDSVGWLVSNQPNSNEFGDDDLYAGVYTGNTYISGIQFDLLSLPADAEILDAELRLTGQTRQYLTGAGTWVVEMLTSAVDAGWPGHGYTDIAGAATVGALKDVEENDFTLEPDQLDVDRVNVLGMTDTLLGELIARRGSTGHVSFRLQGPKAGNSNTFSWDTGYGIGGLGKPPILHIEYLRPGGPGPSPTPTPSPTATPLPPTDDIGIGALISAINEARTALGLSTLHPNDALMEAAEAHSSDLANNNRWSHTGSDGSTPQERMRRAGYPLGDGDEALAGNSTDINEIVTAWTRNPRHYAMLMSPDYVDIGAGHAYNAASLYRDYWTLLVARPAEGGGSPGDYQVQLTPRESKVGWVVSDEPNVNHFGDDDMYAGFYNALIYVGAVQFDLASVPDEAQISGATLTLIGQADEYLTGAGTWTVHMLDSAVDFDWASHGYRAIADTSSLGVAGNAMEGSDLGVDRPNELTFSDAMLAQLADRVHSTGLASFRIDGPKSGATDVFSWDSGYGVGGLSKPPVLTISYSMP